MQRILSTCNALLLVLVILIWFPAALLADFIMRIFYAIKLEKHALTTLYYLSFFTEKLLKAWGTRINFDNNIKIEENKPIIFVCNHHSSLDILLLVTKLCQRIDNRKLGFISRSGLDKNIPAISVYLRKYCYSLKGIDESKSSLGTSDQHLLPLFAQGINQQKNAVVLFPEGVKPIKDQEYCRRFSRNGFRILLEHMPDAQLIPIVIKGSGDFYTTPRRIAHVFKHLPTPFTTIEINMLPPIKGTCIESKINHAQRLIFNEFERLNEHASMRAEQGTEKRKWTP